MYLKLFIKNQNQILNNNQLLDMIVKPYFNSIKKVWYMKK